MLTLKYAISSGATELEFNEASDVGRLCQTLRKPAHVYLSIGIAGKDPEVVLATACTGTKVTVLRGQRGTEKLGWGYGACVNQIEEVSGTFCEAEKDAACGILNGVTASPSFELNRLDPCSLHIELKPTGVTPGNYCGLRINQYGQVMSLPPDWPARCLPVFNPCGPCDTGSQSEGGVTQADQVIYTPLPGACAATGNTIELAVQQLDQAFCAHLQSHQGSVQSVGVGAGLQNNGSTTNPVLALTPVGISSSVYAGFSINQFGQVVSYTPPIAPQAVTLAPSGAVTASYNLGTDTWTIGVPPATTTDHGSVVLANVTEAQTYEPGNPLYAALANKAVSLQSLSLWWQTKEAAIVHPVFDLSSPTAATAIPATATIPFFSVGNRKILLPDAIRSLGGAWAKGRFVTALPGLATQLNVQSAALISTTVVRITLQPGLTADYHVSVTPLGAPQALGVTIVSAQVFDITFSGAVPAQFTFTVTEL